MSEGRRLALLVASSEFSDPTLQRLVTPSLDAIGLERVLKDPNIGNFEVKTLVDQPAFEIQREIELFLTDCRKEDVVLLYFSGHGVKDDDGRLYLATTDTRRGLFRSTAIPALFINETMSASRSQQQILILDCCHSGAFARGMVAKGGESVDLRERFEGRGRVVLTASNATQYAFQGEEIIGQAQQSVFTRCLVRGLETGEADRDGDGWVSIMELYDYLYDNVVKETPQQTPSVICQELQGDIVIAANPHGVERLTAEDARLATMYADGLTALTSGQLNQALRIFERIQSVKPGYRDVVKQIAWLKPVVHATEHISQPVSSPTPAAPRKTKAPPAGVGGKHPVEAPQENPADPRIIQSKKIIDPIKAKKTRSPIDVVIISTIILSILMLVFSVTLVYWISLPLIGLLFFIRRFLYTHGEIVVLERKKLDDVYWGITYIILFVIVWLMGNVFFNNSILQVFAIIILIFTIVIRFIFNDFRKR